MITRSAQYRQFHICFVGRTIEYMPYTGEDDPPLPPVPDTPPLPEVPDMPPLPEIPETPPLGDE
jgi:hypothetical protein